MAKLLLEKGCKVYGGVRRISQAELVRLERLGIEKDVELKELGLIEQNNIFRVICDVGMDEFYNLATQSFVAASWELPNYAADVDSMAVARSTLLNTYGRCVS